MTRKPPTHAQVIIIGAGSLGICTAYWLSKLGFKDILVLEKGEWPRAGGSTTHSVGSVKAFDLECPTMTNFSQDSIRLFRQVGSLYETDQLILSRTPERTESLKAQADCIRASGFQCEVASGKEKDNILRENIPQLNARDVEAVLYIKKGAGTGRVCSVTATSRIAASCGSSVRVLPFTTVSTIVVEEGVGVKGVELAHRERKRAPHQIKSKIVVCCAGVWGVDLLRSAGVSLPLVPAHHMWALSSPLPFLRQFLSSPSLGGLSGSRFQDLPSILPAVSDPDAKLYIHQLGDRLGMGSYDHAPTLIDSEALALHSTSVLPFTTGSFRKAQKKVEELFPAIPRDMKLEEAFNGLINSSPDGKPVAGPIEGVQGLFVGMASPICCSGGVGKALAWWIKKGVPPKGIDSKVISPSRFTDNNPHSPENRLVIASVYANTCNIPEKELIPQPKALRAKY